MHSWQYEDHECDEILKFNLLKYEMIMLQSEFIDRTGYMPTYDEYRAIESLYNDFDGDKDAFCEHFRTHKSVLNKVREIACASFAKEREELLREKGLAESEVRKTEDRLTLSFNLERRQWAQEKAKYEEEIRQLKKRVEDISESCETLSIQRQEYYDAYHKAMSDISTLKNAFALLKA